MKTTLFNDRIFSKLFKALSDRSRLRILQTLSSGEMSVSEITKAVGFSQPTVSRHLSILREAEVVVDRREGKQVFYSLNKIMVENCCTGFCSCLGTPMHVVIKRKKK